MYSRTSLPAIADDTLRFRGKNPAFMPLNELGRRSEAYQSAKLRRRREVSSQKKTRSREVGAVTLEDSSRTPEGSYFICYP